MSTMMLLAWSDKAQLRRAPLPLRLAAVLQVLMLSMSLVFATAGTAPAAPVPGIDIVYTLDADFDKGTLLNINHDAPNSDQLQLNRTTTPFPFVNVPASNRGTIIRIDVNTGAILGEYWTSPQGMGKDPSRTTVDQRGNVWVANRAENDEAPPGSGILKGSVARVGLIVGGTRANADGTADPAGQYLKSPFQYNTCVDRDGDGLIKTSRGLGNILPWTNAGDADRYGGVSTAEDECLINYTRVTGTGTRTLAIDANNDVWVGGVFGFGPYHNHEKLNGVTGQPVPGTQFNLGCGGYGGLIDRNGILWSASQGAANGALLRYDPATGTGACLTGRGDYGLAIDPNTGNIWHSGFAYSNDVHELNAAGDEQHAYPQGFAAQGVVVDSNSHVWVSEIFGSRVAHFAPDPAVPGKHLLVGYVTSLQGATGVAVDTNGKIWVSEYTGSRTSRIDPAAGALGCGGTGCGAVPPYRTGATDLSVSLGANAYPYNYSDMTGFVSIGATAPQGSWTVIQDSGTSGTSWGTVTWNTEPQGSTPAGTSIVVEARASDTEAGLSGEAFIAVSNGALFSLTGRYIEVRSTLRANADGVSPVLSDLRVQATPLIEGRMTGGGGVITAAGLRVTHGFDLNCEAGEGSSSLQINWGRGNRFHLETLTSAYCSDDHAIVSTPPAAEFDTYEGKGAGRLNGVAGATAEWTFTDAGEPGRNDTARIVIKDASGTVVLSVSGKLAGGNHQSHNE